MWKQYLVLVIGKLYGTTSGVTSNIDNAQLFATTDDVLSTVTDPDPNEVYQVIPVNKFEPIP